MGGYVYAKLKSEEWGSKVVTQLSEYIRSKRPDIKGYSRSSIYNMVMFYDEYSSDAFNITLKKYITTEFVQTLSGQIQIGENQQSNDVITIVQTASAQLINPIKSFPKILEFTTLSNHIEILCRCRNNSTSFVSVL